MAYLHVSEAWTLNHRECADLHEIFECADFADLTMCNAVTLVWGLLRLAPITILNFKISGGGGGGGGNCGWGRKIPGPPPLYKTLTIVHFYVYE